MVKQCTSTYPADKEERYKALFEKYPYPLHTFQKHAIEATWEGHHALVTAHTGSGKTLCGEFAIEHFTGLGKKVIYTTPLKALSNQKFYDFTHKFPHISFGILTGDLKSNPDAQVLIMTAEILLNKLITLENGEKKNPPNHSTSFEMDISNELGCVVMDEVHFINDASRGHVWEQTIMMLPPQVSLVMLSATIDNPARFAAWCERQHPPHPQKKEVYIASNHKRAVPLTHYTFMTSTTALFKVIKDKSQQDEIKKTLNKPFVIQTPDGVFHDAQFFTTQKTQKLLQSKDIPVKRAHVLNQVTRYLVDNAMLPALCFVFSRKQLEQCAHEVSTILLEDDSKVPYIIRRECEVILRKLPNYKEYMELPETIGLMSLLEKGIAIHHAGILSPLREMVELLYAKGFIKLLFATETMSTGINMPVKTVLFTSLEKYDGKHVRPMLAHEYTQAAGRAGRLGIDTVGHVIHLNNLFKPTLDLVTYKSMLHGTPQTLSSQFTISYSLLLNLVSMKPHESDYLGFIQKSMIELEIAGEIADWEQRIRSLRTGMANIQSTLKTDQAMLEQVAALTRERNEKINNKRRKEIDALLSTLPPVDPKDMLLWKQYRDQQDELNQATQSLENTRGYLQTQIRKGLDGLQRHSYIDKTDTEEYVLTRLGTCAAQLREVNGLLFAPLLPRIKEWCAEELIALFGCFTHVTVPEDLMALAPQSGFHEVDALLYDIQTRTQDPESLSLYEEAEDNELPQYDLLPYVGRWGHCTNAHECIHLLKQMEQEKGIFLGEFVKALLKINNISAEMEKVAEYLGEIAFLNELKKIAGLTLKYVATNQSLYV